MPRRKKIVQANEKPKFCVVCGDVAKGVNFNALTCMSCKAFFRRNAFKREEMNCSFANTCQVDQVTRKFCSRCRLQKCLDAGMKREWILSDQDKLMIKQKKMTKFVIRRQKQEMQQESSSVPINHQQTQDLDEIIFNNSTIELEDNSQLLLNQWSSLDDCFDQLMSGDSKSTFDDLLDELDDSMVSDLFSSSSSSESQHSQLSITELIKEEDKDFPTKIDLLNPVMDEDLLDSNNLESLSTITHAQKQSIFTEIGFPSRELILPEKYLLKELMDACGVLQNPYQKIIDCNNDYYYLAANSGHIFRTQYHFHRMIQMSKRLSSFRAIHQSDQVRMLKNSLLEMLNIQSIIMYNPDRKCWRFIDDRVKSSVMVRMDLIKPFCSVNSFEQHQNAPTLFREEWKRDGVIFDLLLVIILFTPRSEYLQNEKIHEEHTRYTCLLRRYLEMKYSTFTEALDSYNQLMNNVAEMRRLNVDIKNFFQSYGELLRDSPLFVQVFDLDNIAQPLKPNITTCTTVNMDFLSLAESNAFDFSNGIDDISEIFDIF